MTARLPTVAGDNDAWGTLLNTFLAVTLNADGTLSSGAATSGKVPVADGAAGVAYAFPPGYEIAAAQKTSNTSITSTSSSSPDTIVSLGAVTYDGTAVWFEAYCGGLNIGSGEHTLEMVLVEDGTTKCKIAEVNSTASISQSVAGVWKRKITPSAGSHTYLLAAYVDGGTGLAQAGNGLASAFAPVYLRASKA